MRFGQHFELLQDVANTTDNRRANFEKGEVVYFVEHDRNLGYPFLVFAARDGWLLRLHADVVPQYLKGVVTHGC